jgi:hypothetical protein
MSERALAHIETIAKLDVIPNYDRVEQATILGWKVIVRKNEFQVGDKCCYFEIDSKLPEKEWSEFLRPKHFKIKTQKMCKTISQGLALPISCIPELKNKTVSIGEDVTELLGFTYSVEEDNHRKSKNGDPNAKYKSMAARHQKLFKTKPFRWLMKKSWGRKLLFAFFGRKKDKPKAFPDWIVKTDETRIENAPFYLESTDKYVKTEKIDGTSSTYFVDYTKNKKGEFGVCSRNVRQLDEKQECYHTCGNTYWEMVGKYNIDNALRDIAIKNSLKRVVLQGETFGESIQGNPYKMNCREFRAFNLIFEGKRLGSVEARDILAEYNIPFVPIISEEYELPKTMEEMKLEADGYSEINPKVMREGFVYRSLDGTKSFKNVSRNFLLKHNS